MSEKSLERANLHSVYYTQVSIVLIIFNFNFLNHFQKSAGHLYCQKLLKSQIAIENALHCKVYKFKMKMMF